MIKEITSIRPALRAWAERQPDPIRLRAKRMDKNLQALAKNPNDAPPFEMLVKNHAALVLMISSFASDE